MKSTAIPSAPCPSSVSTRNPLRSGIIVLLYPLSTARIAENRFASVSGAAQRKTRTTFTSAFATQTISGRVLNMIETPCFVVVNRATQCHSCAGNISSGGRRVNSLSCIFSENNSDLRKRCVFSGFRAFERRQSHHPTCRFAAASRARSAASLQGMQPALQRLQRHPADPRRQIAHPVLRAG